MVMASGKDELLRRHLMRIMGALALAVGVIILGTMYLPLWLDRGLVYVIVTFLGLAIILAPVYFLWRDHGKMGGGK